MNEETAKLISELAQKLGTTAEHLWGVLVRQAPIAEGAYVLKLCVVYGVTIFVTRKAFMVLKKGARKDEGDSGLHQFRMLEIISAVMLFISMWCLIFTDYGTTMAGFFNPEFWAFKQIVK